MRKLLFAIVLLATGTLTAAAEEKVIDQSALPQSAQYFVETHYPEDKISIATSERDLFDKDYKVILTSGVKLEFDSKGNWTEIECKRNSAVPMAVIPAKVAEYVQTRFPSNKIVKIEKSSKRIDVELDNDLELEFNKKGEMVKIDN